MDYPGGVVPHLNRGGRVVAGEIVHAFLDDAAQVEVGGREVEGLRGIRVGEDEPVRVGLLAQYLRDVGELVHHVEGRDPVRLAQLQRGDHPFMWRHRCHLSVSAPWLSLCYL